jgi:hypothetical protein
MTLKRDQNKRRNITEMEEYTSDRIKDFFLEIAASAVVCLPRCFSQNFSINACKVKTKVCPLKG